MRLKVLAILFSASLVCFLSAEAFAVSWKMVQPPDLDAGINPASVATADFNGDGIPDIAIADKTVDGKIAIHLGGPGGHFKAIKYLSAGSNPISVTTGDFDGDGKADIAVADWDNKEARVFLGKGNGKFKAPTVISGLGLNPVHVRAGKLTAAGNDDLVFANFGDGTISVVIGNGDGTFHAPKSIAVGANPRHVCLTRLRGAGQPLDIVVTLWGEGAVAILLGNGDGTFKTPVKVAAGFNPLAVEAADLNGDGNMDLAVSLFKNDQIAILAGNGDGTFQARKLLPVSSGPQEIVLKDFDGDGNTDIAVACSLGNSVSVYLGRGGGHFEAMRSFPTGKYPAAIASADFNRDGLPDLVVADVSDNKLTHLKGFTRAVGLNGSGQWNYVSSVNLTAGTGPSALLVDDFNYDGVMDIAVANKGSNNISVFLNRRFGNHSGFGNFSSHAVTTPAPGAPPSFATLSTISAPAAMASANFNNHVSINNPVANFRAGIAVANSGNNTVAVLLPTFSNFSGGMFRLPGSGSSPQILKTGIKNPSAIKTADFRKDGRMDIAVCNQDNNTVAVFLGNGDGTFKAPSIYQLAPGDSGPVSMAIGDFNKDGVPDIAVGNKGSNTVSVLLGKGNGTFKQAISSNANTLTLSAIAARDLNGDGNLDLAVADELGGSVKFLINEGGGKFRAGRTLPVGASPKAVLAQDLTDHKRGDIMTANSGSNDLTLYIGNTVGVFNAPRTYPDGTAPVAIAAHDFNGDGATDIAVANSAGVTVMFGQDQLQLTITVNDPAMGTVSPPSGLYEGGKELKLTATPNTGFKFVKWTGSIDGSANPRFVLMNSKKDITAVFAPI